MKINSDSYITDIGLIRISNFSYGIGLLSSVMIVIYYLTTEKNGESANFYFILIFLVFLSLMIGRIARLISGGYFWHHIKNDLVITQNTIQLKEDLYKVNKILLLKFNITDLERKKPFLYRYILKDTRNMIKFKTEKNIIQIHFKPVKEEQVKFLTELRSMWSNKHTVANSD